MLKALLGSKARVALLAELLLEAEREVHLRELVRATGFAPRTVQVEIDRLVGMGLIRERRSGNRRYLSAEKGHPLFEPLRQLVMETHGLESALREAVDDEDSIDLALLFGSAARGESRVGSDVDIMIVGKVNSREALGMLHPVAERFGKEINPVVYSVEDFEERRVHPGFVSSVLRSNPKVLKGRLDDLA